MVQVAIIDELTTIVVGDVSWPRVAVIRRCGAQIVYVEGLRQQADEFQRAVEEECRTVRALLLDERVRQAKRRSHAR